MTISSYNITSKTNILTKNFFGNTYSVKKLKGLIKKTSSIEKLQTLTFEILQNPYNLSHSRLYSFHNNFVLFKLKTKINQTLSTNEKLSLEEISILIDSIGKITRKIYENEKTISKDFGFIKYISYSDPAFSHNEVSHIIKLALKKLSKVCRSFNQNMENYIEMRYLFKKIKKEIVMEIPLRNNESVFREMFPIPEVHFAFNVILGRIQQLSKRNASQIEKHDDTQRVRKVHFKDTWENLNLHIETEV